MPDINPALPIIGQPDATEDPKVVTALTQLVAAVNDVDSAQIADGSIVISDLAAGLLRQTGAVVTALPTSPVDGEECFFLADDADGVVWHLKYRADSASAYKWEFVGGSSLLEVDGGTTSWSGDAYTASGQPSPITPPLAGDYDAVYTCGFQNGISADTFNRAYAALFRGSTGTTLAAIAGLHVYDRPYGGAQANEHTSFMAQGRLTAVGTDEIINLRVASLSGITSTFQGRSVRLTPIRVG